MSVRRITAAMSLALAVAAAGCGQEGPPAPGAGSPPGGSPGSAVSSGSGPSARGSDAGPAPTASAPGDPSGEASRGRQVYLAQCVACHNSDPTRPGPIGPALQGSSAELLAAKVLHGSYPAGYRPQRDSRVMPARPDLSASIADLAAFLR